MKTWLISVIVVLFFMFFAVAPFLLVCLSVWLSPDPAKPKVLHGEFPFNFEYEKSGQKVVINDSIICDFDGIGMNEGVGKYNKWKEQLTNGGDTEILLLKVNENEEIRFNVGSAEYYMGAMNGNYGWEGSFPDADLVIKNGGSTSISKIIAKDLWGKYQIKLIKWEPSSPISQK